MSNSTPVTFKTVTFFWVHITTLVIKRVSSFVAHEAAGSYVFGRHIYNCKKKAVFCATLFYAAATPEGYPKIILGIDAHSVCPSASFFQLKQNLAVSDFTNCLPVAKKNAVFHPVQV